MIMLRHCSIWIDERSACWLPLLQPAIAVPVKTPAGTGDDFRRREARGPQRHAAATHLSGPGWHRAGVPLLSCAGDSCRHGDPDPRLSGLERGGASAGEGAGGARHRKPMRRICAAMAARARAAISAISASLMMISPIWWRMIRASGRPRRCSLIGHSSGGGFALRIAGSNDAGSVRAHVAAGAMARHQLVSSRDNAGGWASPNLPRIIALSRAAQRRHHLLRRPAGDRICRAAKFSAYPHRANIRCGC